eukprot:CAMPEP_0119532176 /NCGR_PEP_ID=MMETSP1344-20130328/45751_1 /TAXON_ID=236787 /ORGANISM="Florenciella parvula, Strain CCMP2471" /LENGTH=45 /DNA_ID= /DNA_START= /DNA_END= /DNA_ORIENTATION=
MPIPKLALLPLGWARAATRGLCVARDPCRAAAEAWTCRAPKRALS